MKGISSQSEVGRVTSTREKVAESLGFKEVGVGGARMEATARKLPTALCGSVISLPLALVGAAGHVRQKHARISRHSTASANICAFASPANYLLNPGHPSAVRVPQPGVCCRSDQKRRLHSSSVAQRQTGKTIKIHLISRRHAAALTLDP